MCMSKMHTSTKLEKSNTNNAATCMKCPGMPGTVMILPCWPPAGAAPAPGPGASEGAVMAGARGRDEGGP